MKVNFLLLPLVFQRLASLSDLVVFSENSLIPDKILSLKKEFHIELDP